MKLCPACGRESPDDARFCAHDRTPLEAASRPGDLSGTVVAERYRIEKKLGEGGMGAVYLAEHLAMGRLDAIKILGRQWDSDSSALARFRREAASAARINHPNVCTVYDFGTTSEGLPFLAMEYVQGETLKHRIDREGRMPLSRVGHIVRQVAAALDAAHDLRIVHRDLKPDNIMLATGTDGSDFVKVVDFGIAKTMDLDAKSEVTRTGLVAGTPEYMSPEQLAGDSLDARSDIYSLGLVLFQMLTGSTPFPGNTMQETMTMRLTDTPLSLKVASGCDFDPAIEAVVDRALARLPKDRYDRAGVFARDFVNAITSSESSTVGDVSEVVSPVPIVVSPAPSAVDEKTVQLRMAEPLPKTQLWVPDRPPKGGHKRWVAIAIVMGAVGSAAAITLGMSDMMNKGPGSAETPAPVLTTLGDSETVVTHQPKRIAPPPTIPERAVTPRTPPSSSEQRQEARPTQSRETNDSLIVSNQEAAIPADVLIIELLDRFDSLIPDPLSIRHDALAAYHRPRLDDPTQAAFAHIVALTFVETGQVDSASSWARRALQHHPTHKGALSVINLLP